MELFPNQTFFWEESADFLHAFSDEFGGAFDAERGCFVGGGWRVHPPLVFPVPEACASLEDYVESLPEDLPMHSVLLLQAGAVSMGLFEDGEALSTKSFKKYVVRGKGRAQPIHLETKGKSRYGSRLRLQNAKRLLEETNERLIEWEEEYGPSELVFYNSPVRLWADLFATKPPPPFDAEAPVRIPLDLPRPTTSLLLRTYRGLCHGRVEVAEDAAAE